MYEDDKDKVRRNLVALSGFILVSAYLELKLPNKIFEVQLPRESYKIWVVVLIALAYTFWRFIHTEEARKARSSIASQYADCRLKGFNFLIVRDLKRVFRSKSPRWINASPIEAKLAYERSQRQYQKLRLTALIPSSAQRWPHNGFERWSGSMAVDIKFAYLYTEEFARIDDPSMLHIEQNAGTTVEQVPFTFPRWIDFFITLSSIVILLARSEIIPEVIIPYGMATSAGMIALVRALS